MKPLLKDLDFVVASQLIICEPAVIKAVCRVEAPRGGFMKDDRPLILFEPYRFSNLTAGKYQGTVIQIDNVNYPLSLSGHWDREVAMYGPSSIQYEKLGAAQKLDNDAALKSCSWGKFQIMGENFNLCGFSNVTDFVTAMNIGEKEHLMAFVRYVKSRKLDDMLRLKDWAGFALHYNGPGYKQNQYDSKLQDAYQSIVSAT